MRKMSMTNIIQVVRELLLSRCSAPVPCAAAIRPIPDNCDEVHQTFVFTMFKGRLLCYVYASSNSSCEVLPETAGAGTSLRYQAPKSKSTHIAHLGVDRGWLIKILHIVETVTVQCTGTTASVLWKPDFTGCTQKSSISVGQQAYPDHLDQLQR